MCKRRTARPGRLETPRKGIGRARCGTPQSADAITGLRYPHHAAHAEACLHSATAAPAPSRCIRRRRRSTPQPLAGEPSGRRLPKASPARGGGCAVRRRRRGALPACGGDILQNSAGHCPASAGDDADIAPETLRRRKAPSGGRKRPPYKAAASGRRQIRVSHLPGPSEGRCKHRPLRGGGGAPQPSSAYHACRPRCPPHACLAM